MQQIWGDSYEGFDRTIDNHVTRLRKNLALSAKRPKLSGVPAIAP
jgi:DNA-binding response OmpR family regulator